MYIEFGEQLINSVYFGKVEKVDSDNDGTPVYSLQYELINGAKYLKDYSSETARDDDYDALKQEGSSGETTVIANPDLAGTESDLTGLQVGNTKYAVPSGSGKSFNFGYGSYDDTGSDIDYTITTEIYGESADFDLVAFTGSDGIAFGTDFKTVYEGVIDEETGDVTINYNNPLGFGCIVNADILAVQDNQDIYLYIYSPIIRSGFLIDSETGERILWKELI